MGSLFRSEEMALCQLFIESEAAYNCVSELGECGVAQFRDLNPGVNAFQRKFANEVRRCDEMECKLLYLEREIRKSDIKIIDTKSNSAAPQPREMTNLEARFDKAEQELRGANESAKALRANVLELTELKQILYKVQDFLTGHEFTGKDTIESLSSLINDNNDTGKSGLVPLQLSFVVGVIPRERMPTFERMLWRLCHANVFVRQSEILLPLIDPITGNSVHKTAFIIFFHGDQLRNRIKKVCDGFRAKLYTCPETHVERQKMTASVRAQLEDLKTVLGQTEDHRLRILTTAARNINDSLIKVRKMKAIYHTLNFFNLDVTQKCLIAEIWVPVLDIKNIQLALNEGSKLSGSSIPPILNRMGSSEDPPTFNRTDKYTCGFQGLIDAYGVPSYRELNPTPFTIITFPFLFAVMFGDLGHGFIMLLFALVLILKEKSIAERKLDEISRIFFSGRYLVLLMGLFSMYTGFIYNDVFSKSFNIFGSGWPVAYDKSQFHLIPKKVQLDPISVTESPYLMGMDPVWQLAGNKISFLNSFKMKVSIIFGVIHMMFGIVVGLWNNLYFKRTVNIFCETIPQFIFLVFLFGYLVFLVFIKWIMYGAKNDVVHGTHCAPSVLITFIDMMLANQPGKKAVEVCETKNMFAGQKELQTFLLITALICVPWMMFAKPIVKIVTMKKKHHQIDNHEANNKQSEHNGEEETVGDILILQAIHTIEYVLGCVSHTASYLRLWALSLAHSQLSDVLWARVMHNGLNGGMGGPGVGGFTLWIIFACWAVLTICILVLMEGLSAFLHTLRLHWVEFQSKFYTGTGHSFQPFSFKEINSNQATVV